MPLSQMTHISAVDNMRTIKASMTIVTCAIYTSALWQNLLHSRL